MVASEYCSKKCNACPLGSLPADSAAPVRMAINATLTEYGGPDGAKRELETNDNTAIGKVYDTAFDSLPRYAIGKMDAADIAFVAVEVIANGRCSNVPQTTT